MNEEKRYAAKVSKRLEKWAPDAACSLDHADPLQLLVSTILSAQCTDVRVNLVTPELFRRYPMAADFAAAEPLELEEMIHSTGFYHSKAKNIIGACQLLENRYAGEVPADMDSLLELPGVGRKTANVVLGNAFGIALGVVVDTHVARLSFRLGLTDEKNPEKIERDLVRSFPEKVWIALSHRLIRLGRKYCTARKPNCRECPMNDICPKRGV